tara:strand:- start:27377 stop:29497 length:2121 start_codon:yes stop_codon:yes gene_type:complete
MKQIVQNLNSKEGIEIADFPSPMNKPGHVLIKTKKSLVSLGTERMIVEFGNANLLHKAKQKPDQVKRVLNKIKTDGLGATLDTVRTKLDQAIPLGYCNYGVVIESSIQDIKVGDRVASNGPHAEIVRVPEKLVAKVPDNVSGDEAVFTVIGSIGLQGIRLAKPTFGETIVVIGLGLVGFITAQLLKANGINVICIDIDKQKCELASSMGINTINPSTNDQVKAVMSFTNNIGADGVIITAATKSNDVISHAAQMSRKRGRIILVGVVGLNIDRSDFYEKELTFQVSCSYGPGRYDESYELQGIDYPLPYVRWTEKRNFEAVLNSMSNGSLKLNQLISEKIKIDDAKKIYSDIGNKGSIASIILYPEIEEKQKNKNIISIKNNIIKKSRGVIGIIGSGNFTRTTILPSLKNTNAKIKYIASSSGISGTKLAKKYNINYSTTDYKKILNDEDVDSVLITTRHDSHAKFVIDALKSGKNVFVEKPLALNETELDNICLQYNQVNDLSLMVGFNRRFSPHIKLIKNSIINSTDPINLVITMNAGAIPLDHWVHDMKVGGGRIIGEACHSLDVCVYLSGSLIKSVCMNSLGESPIENTDNASLLLKFENGSNAVINYFSNGSKAYSKERVEVFSNEKTWIIDNYRTTKVYGAKSSNFKTKIDKGHKNQFNKYILHLINGGESIIPFHQLVNVTRASFKLIESMKSNQWVNL